ncbi:MAG: DUF3149 domain-containing protein [Rhodocyclaceae bacterium]|nr:DUF3149 domain-containing protein [Rhodocyclaceae bacterium]
MQAIKELFSSDIGLLSVFTVVVAIGIVTFIYNFVRKQMDNK